MSEPIIYRKVTDDNFEHCAKLLLPGCVVICRDLTEADVEEAAAARGVHPSDILNAIQIAAEVAEAFSIERYGKPHFRIPAPTSPTHVRAS